MNEIGLKSPAMATRHPFIYVGSVVLSNWMVRPLICPVGREKLGQQAKTSGRIVSLDAAESLRPGT